MSFKIQEITQSKLQDFYQNFSGEKTFLQSALYGEWRKAIGENIIYYGLFQSEEIIGSALLQKITSKFKTYLHCPHGPLMTQPQNQEVWEKFLQFYKTLGKEQQCDLVRISPLQKSFYTQPDETPTPNPLIRTLKKESFVPAAIHLINPELTWVLDIDRPLEDILKTMRKSTRYEVNRIEKSGITVAKGNAAADLDVFWELHTNTVKRQKFVPFPRKHTEAQLEVFGDNCLIFNAEFEQENCSSSIVIFDNQAGYYHQGASIYSKFPCSHATLWEAIKEAKSRGCKEFNFWGVSHEHKKKHPWHGLSKFKRGFGGEEREYIHVHDFEITPKAKLNRAIEWYRKKKRNY